MSRLNFLCAVWLVSAFAPISYAQVSQITVNADGDQYLYQNTYNDSRSYMNVGQYYGGFSTHYYVGLASWNNLNLSPLVSQTNLTLSLYVQNFVNPVFLNGNTNSQPIGYTYPTNGNFTLKVVALSNIPSPASMNDGWVKTNMILAPGVGSVTLTNSGYNKVQLGSTVANWISGGNGPRWLGFVGTGSTTSIYTSVQLGTLEAKYDLDGNVTAPPSPMYLSAPPPAPVARAYRMLNGNQLEMTFEVVPAVSYSLKTKSNLSDSNWATVSTFTAESTSTNVTVPMTNSAGRGFFRLEVAP